MDPSHPFSCSRIRHTVSASLELHLMQPDISIVYSSVVYDWFLTMQS